MTSTRVAALQMRTGMDPARNLVEFEALVREAASRGANYVQSPEMTGVLVRGRNALMERIVAADEDPLVRRASELAAELSIFVHIGSTAVLLDDGKSENLVFLCVTDCRLITTNDKFHMSDVDLNNDESWPESATYSAGYKATVAELPFGNLGIANC